MAIAVVLLLGAGFYTLSLSKTPALSKLRLDALRPALSESEANSPAAEPQAVANLLPPLAAGQGPLSPADVSALMDHFRVAYETRDSARLLGLFAPNAIENGRRGLGAIGGQWRDRLGALEQVHYTMGGLEVEPRGVRAAVRTPFAISYRGRSGVAGEVRGLAEWELERRDGVPRIVLLNYRLETES
jgi:hypothetical protein